MATDFGPATISVKLNAEEAKRQIEELRREIQKNPPAMMPARSPAQDRVIRKTNPKASHPSVSGDVGDDPYYGESPYFTHDNVADGLRLLKWLKTTDRMRKFAPIHVAKAQEDASLYNRGVSYAQDKLGLAEDAVGTVGGVAAATAAVYAATTVASKTAPYALKAIEQVVKIPPEVGKVLDDFKAVINNLEHRISNVVKAPLEASNFWANGARITGQLPDFIYYWNQRYDLGVAEDDLQSKFDHFKRMEVAEAVGKGVGEVFKNSFSR